MSCFIVFPVSKFQKFLYKLFIRRSLAEHFRLISVRIRSSISVICHHQLAEVLNLALQSKSDSLRDRVVSVSSVLAKHSRSSQVCIHTASALTCLVQQLYSLVYLFHQSIVAKFHVVRHSTDAVQSLGFQHGVSTHHTDSVLREYTAKQQVLHEVLACCREFVFALTQSSYLVQTYHALIYQTCQQRIYCRRIVKECVKTTASLYLRYNSAYLICRKLLRVRHSLLCIALRFLLVLVELGEGCRVILHRLVAHKHKARMLYSALLYLLRREAVVLCILLQRFKISAVCTVLCCLLSCHRSAVTVNNNAVRCHNRHLVYCLSVILHGYHIRYQLSLLVILIVTVVDSPAFLVHGETLALLISVVGIMRRCQTVCINNLIVSS